MTTQRGGNIALYCTGLNLEAPVCRPPACSPLIRKFFLGRFGKRVLPAAALAPIAPAYYGDDAEDEAELLEELLAEAGLE